MRIDGDIIYLTSITYDDTDDIVRWRNSEAIREQFIYRQKFTAEGHNNWMRTKVETGQVVQFIVWDKASDTKIGSIYLRDIDREQGHAEYGVFLGETQYIGRGIGKECYRLLLNYAFTELGLNTVFIRALADNIRSIKCAEHVGFTATGERETIEVDGQQHDIVFMEIKAGQVK